MFKFLSIFLNPIAQMSMKSTVLFIKLKIMQIKNSIHFRLKTQLYTKHIA